MRWGLIPSWAKSASVGNRMINARAETVAEMPSFRTALQRRRCLVLADGFYEWQGKGSSRRPMRITMASGEPFAFAGLWDAWRDPKGEVVRSCAIITTDMSEFLNQSKMTERRAFVETFLKQIVVTPGSALLRYTIFMPDDSRIPGRSAEEMALDGSVLSTRQ